MKSELPVIILQLIGLSRVFVLMRVNLCTICFIGFSYIPDICHMETFIIWRQLFFVTIYAVLSQNLLCRDLRTFEWRKIRSEVVLVEKKDKYQVCFLNHY